MAFTNPVIVGGGPSAQSIREAVTDARHLVGTIGEFPDGRKFRYASSTSSSALDVAQPCMSEAVGANFTNISLSAAAAIGATSVAVTLGGSETVAKDALSGGYLVVNDGTGQGYTYTIRGNAAVAAVAALTVELAEEIVVALGASGTSQVTVVKNRWAELTEAAAGHVHFSAGWPQLAVPAGNTNTQYFWVQTKGINGAEADASTAVGASLQSGATAGQVEVGDGAAQYIGTQLVTGVATEYNPIDAAID